MFSSKKIRPFKIYALIHQGNVFVGKTQGEINPVFYRHCRGENPFTAQYFYPKGSKTPTIHILESITCNTHEAYRHIVAWVNIFQDAGYQIINPHGTIDDAYDLHPQTRALVYSLRPFAFNDFLSETQHKKQGKGIPAATPKQPETKASKKPKEKITLWATPEEKASFISYAKSLGLTQSQTLRYLMSKVHLEEADPLFPAWDNDTFMHLVQESHEQTVKSKDKRIYELETTLRAYIEREKDEAKKLNQCCAIAQKSLIAFYDLFDSSAMLPLDIERGRYQDFIPKHNYMYPRYSGASLVRLQAILLGEGTAPAKFVLGVDQYGCQIKLRYYPSIYFWGISPGNERFSQRNSVWYMAWRKSGDVAELVAALPMQIKAKYQNPMDENERMHHFVDRLIEEASEYNF